jgi:HD-GYP domain-containing protein (c-di-GMP phosphodiesterase class II)
LDFVDSEIDTQLEAARELLGMELAFVAERHGRHEMYRAVNGDGFRFGVEVGDIMPLERSPFAAADVSEATAIEDAGNGRRARSFISAPVRFADGRLFGRVCCLSAQPTAPLRGRELRLLEVLGRLVAERLRRAEEDGATRAMERETGRRQIEASGVGAFLSALETRDSYTGEHCDAVVELALEVAREMHLTPDVTREVSQVALLHDIGKIGVPDAILQKPGPLTESEWEVMRLHPELGARMVGSVVGLGHLAPSVRAEHERWDGRGYPDGLKGRQIPVASRIVFACDAFHAMTSDRPYRRALGHDEAVRELEHGRGSQFCPETVDALMGRIAPKKPVAVPA